MKYKVIYGSKYYRPEEGNNKAKLIKYANEFLGTAVVMENTTGKVIYENAKMRERTKAREMLDKIVAELRNGTPIEKLISFE